MIVGFPGETAEDFDETLSLTEAVRYHSMFSFKYSPRPNTLAAQADAGRRDRRRRRRARIVALQALQREIQAELHAAGGRAHGARCWSTRRAGGAPGSFRAGPAATP